MEGSTAFLRCWRFMRMVVMPFGVDVLVTASSSGSGCIVGTQ